jgi:hypothetical protein
MQTQSKIVLGIVALIVLFALLSKAFAPDTTPDDVQIDNQLSTAAAAANNKDVGKLMSIVSDNYTDSASNNRLQLNVLLRRALGNVQNLKVTVIPATITVTGNQAISQGNITITGDNQTMFSRSVTLVWKKEETRRYLVIPDKIWRVTRSSYDGNSEMD